MQVSDNPTLRKDTSDPTIICTAYKKNRFYIFSRRNPDETQQKSVKSIYLRLYAVWVCVFSGGDGDRDVFNEKPSK